MIDAQPGFVATWNWLVDFVANLKGDADTVARGSISINTTDTSHPVLTLSGGGGSAAVASGQYVVTNVSYTDGNDANPYCIKIEYGQLSVNGSGEIEIAAVPAMTQYIQTVAHVSYMDNPTGGAS